MPVLNKEKHKKIRYELIFRYEELMRQFNSRELKSATEGTNGRSHWINPSAQCATIGSSLDLAMAVEDFKTILAEIKKLK